MELERQQAAHRRLVENLKRAAEAESARARAAEWRDRDECYRSEAFAGLMRMSDAIARSRSPRYVKGPLAFPSFSSRPRDR